MIKSIFGKSSQNTNVSKYPKRAALVQPNNENANILKTPPPKNSNKMQVEKPIPLVPVRKPLQPIENKNQLAKTKNQGLFMANKENEIPHRNTRNQKPLVIPAKVSVLEIEQESNMVIESTHSDELVAKEDLTYFEKVVEPIEIEIGPTLDLDLLLEIDYGKIIEDDIFNHQVSFVFLSLD